MREPPIKRALLFLAIVAATDSVSIAADPEETSIQSTYESWVDTTNEKDIEKWSTFLADNPYFFPADSVPLTSTDDVIGYYRNLFADPWFSLDCKQEHVEVSGSGDMAWSRGKCNATFTGSDGEKASGASRWFKVWIKQSNGAWRCRVNIWKYVDPASGVGPK